MRLFIFSLLASGLALSAPALLAHGTGESFEKALDGYYVDIGYNPAPASEDELISFDWVLKKETESGADVPFTQVWMRIMKGGETIFAGGVGNSVVGGPRMAYMFTEQGSYEISSRYEQSGVELVSVSFPLEMTEVASGGVTEEGEGTFGSITPAGLLIGFGAGVLLVLALGRFGLRKG